MKNLIRFLTLNFIIALFSIVSFGQTNTFPSNGNVGIGTLNPTHKLHVVAPSNTWKARFQGSDGYIDIGPANTAWAHIYTDRPRFIFNKDVYSITGGFSSYSSSPLYLKTNGSNRMTINTNGNVGIGTITPQAKLDVNGGIQSTVGNYGDWLQMHTNNGEGFWRIHNRQDSGLLAFGYEKNGNQQWNYLNMWADGNVSIGTNKHTGFKLSVGGKVRAEEIEVSLATTWPDYIFEEDYQLTPLKEVEDFIETNKHLPNVPSAKEVTEEGINLGEMDAILLRKIEELTLYVIALKKEDEALKKENEALKLMIENK